MESPEDLPFRSRYRARRTIHLPSLACAALITALLFATLVAMGALDQPMAGVGTRLVAMDVAREKSSRTSSPRAAKAASHAETAPAASSPVVPPVSLPTVNRLQMPEGFIALDRAEMASADIGRMHSAARAAAGTGDDGAAGGGSGAGDGPGGARLFNAEWVREPTDAELAGYFPHGRQPGQWAVIACRTIEHFHVEDCRELEESPAGSGLARAIRQAAWQFLVRPPRMEGKPILGAWVRIRIDIRGHGAPPEQG